MHSRAMLRVLCDSPPRFREIPPEKVEYIRWSPESEVSGIQQMTVGVMPLTETPWNRGKCSYKMLLSMACGVPMVVSPVGMNQDVLRLGESGLSADSPADWVDALDLLLSDPGNAAARGQAGREVVLRHFSLGSVAPMLANELLRVAGRPSSIPVPLR
jgi:glycosyltransferase involved in cell wall biosynthesis